MHNSLELIFLAALAVWLINKLFSSLGTREDNDLIYKNSPFGGNIANKVVTGTAKTVKVKSASQQLEQIKPHLRAENQPRLLQELEVLYDKIPSFVLVSFIRSSYEVFKVLTGDDYARLSAQQISQLIDKGFTRNFNLYIKQRAQLANAELGKVKCYLSEIYFFGNKVYLKTEFVLADHQEYWTFTKNLNDHSPEWLLSNIEQ